MRRNLSLKLHNKQKKPEFVCRNGQLHIISAHFSCFALNIPVFVQILKYFAKLCDCMIAAFRNSVSGLSEEWCQPAFRTSSRASPSPTEGCDTTSSTWDWARCHNHCHRCPPSSKFQIQNTFLIVLLFQSFKEADINMEWSKHRKVCYQRGYKNIWDNR